MSESTSFNRSSGQSTSSSTSTPTSVDSAQSEFALMVAQIAASIGNQVYAWAQGQIATDNAMTDQNVAAFLKGANIGFGLTQQQLDDYNTQIRPEINDLQQEADTWSSAARQAVNAGAAESSVEQGGAQAWQNTIQQLRAEGINVDPSDPKYAAMLSSANTQTGAGAAGAGENARLATETQGQQLRAEEIQLAGQAGSQLSSEIGNDLNSAYSGVSGAENATLSNAQTNAYLQDSAAPYYQAAIGLKYPPIGQNSSSQGQSTQGSFGGSQSSKPDSGSGSSKSGQQQMPGYVPSGGGSGKDSQTPYNPQQPKSNSGGGQQQDSGGGGKLGGGAGSGSWGVHNLPNPNNDPYNNIYDPNNPNAPNPDFWNQDMFDPSTWGNNASGTEGAWGGPPDWQSGYADNGQFTPDQQYGNEWGGNFDPNTGQWTDPNAQGGQYTPDQQFGNEWGGNFDPNTGQSTDPFANTNFENPSGPSDSNFGWTPPPDNSGAYGGTDPYAGGNYGYTPPPDNTNNYNYDPGGGYGGGDTTSTDTSSNYDSGSNYVASSDGGDSGDDSSAAGGPIGYAAGGGVLPAPNMQRPVGQRQQTTGGQVRPQMSPSGGRATDDVSARLNVGEFVVPKDVAAWKGHEFFQNLIEKSRKARMGASAKPEKKPALPNQQQPTFQSKRIA